MLAILIIIILSITYARYNDIDYVIKLLYVGTMKSQEKWVWIITGPNGAGKSSMFKMHLLPQDVMALPHINHDKTAHEIQNETQCDLLDAYLTAYDINRNNVTGFIEKGTSFSIEMSFPVHVMDYKFDTLKKNGWHIGVAAMGIGSTQKSQERIQKRISEGGHNVPFAEMTWHLCLQHTPALLSISDQFVFYDNTDDHAEIVAFKDNTCTCPVIMPDYPKNDYTNRMLSDLMNGTSHQQTPNFQFTF